MNMRAIIAISLAFLLAGCVDIPDHAIQDTSEEIPGVTVSGWIEELGQQIRVEGVMEQKSGTFQYFVSGEGQRPWNLTIQNETGANVLYTDAPQFRDFFYDSIANGDHKTFRFTWDFKWYNSSRVDHYDGPQGYTWAPLGNYTATLQFMFRGVPTDAFEVVIPFEIKETYATSLQ